MDRDEQAIRQVVATWMAATKSGDLETVLSLMTEDVVFLVPGQPPLRGRAAFEAAARQADREDPPQFDGQSDVQEIQVCGDWAFMWSRLTVVVTPPGRHAPQTRAGDTLSVFRKADERWLLARDANLLVPVTPENPAAAT